MTGDSYSTQVSASRYGLWRGRRSLLSALDLELTERCNNNCIHCYINRPADDAVAQDKELPTHAIQGILEEAASLGCLTVRFTGGEPLLREDFEALYLSARKLGLRVLLLTNATRITPGLADLLARIPPLRPVGISVYGMNQSSYERATRAPGSFEAAWRGIELLREREVPFVVSGALLPSTRSELRELETWAASLPEMDRPPKLAMFFDLRARRDQPEKNALIRKLRIPPEEGLELMAGRNEAGVAEMKDFCARFTGPPGEKLFSCGAGAGTASVDPYGYLQPCLQLRHPETVYDLRHGSLRDALERFFPEVRKKTAARPEYLDRCAQCFLKGLCDQCPARSWMEHGTVDTPVEYSCQVTHATARSLGVLNPDEKAWEIEDWRQRIAAFAETTSTEGGAGGNKVES